MVGDLLFIFSDFIKLFSAAKIGLIGEVRRLSLSPGCSPRQSSCFVRPLDLETKAAPASYSGL